MTTEIILKSYPIIKTFYDEIKTKTLYGQFLEPMFVINVSQRTDTDLVTFIFILKIKFIDAEREFYYKMRHEMRIYIEDLENEIVRSELITNFDVPITNGIMYSIQDNGFEFTNMCFEVYNGDIVGRFSWG